MRKVSLLPLALVFVAAVLAGVLVTSAELGVAGTILAGLAIAVVLILAGLVIELRLHGPTRRVHLSRG
jgi:type IV secretory pathway VirB6-like protein